MELQNRKVKLSLSTYDVKFVDKIDTEDGFRWGECNTAHKTITIATKRADGKRKITDDELRATYYHELVHAILDEGLYGELSLNEALVEWVSLCLLQLHKQKAL